MACCRRDIERRELECQRPCINRICQRVDVVNNIVQIDLLTTLQTIGVINRQAFIQVNEIEARIVNPFYENIIPVQFEGDGTSGASYNIGYNGKVAEIIYPSFYAENVLGNQTRYAFSTLVVNTNGWNHPIDVNYLIRGQIENTEGGVVTLCNTKHLLIFYSRG